MCYDWAALGTEMSERQAQPGILLTGVVNYFPHFPVLTYRFRGKKYTKFALRRNQIMTLLRGIVLSVACVTLGVLLLTGCSTAEKSKDVAEGHANYKELCSQCHTIDRVDTAHKTMSKQEMRGVVEKMSKKPGAKFDMNDINYIIEQIY